MYVRHLSLTNYRNYARLEVDLPARIHILQGENAQGKTNLLESIYYLSTTKSPLAAVDRQLMNWAADDEVIPHTEIRADFVRGGEDHTLEAVLVKEQAANGGEVEAVFRRQLLLNGVPRRAVGVVGRLNVVLFLPQDIVLVSGGPGERRRYLDTTLCQIDAVYLRTLSRYNRVMTQRNALLRQMREGHRDAGGELAYWDEQLARTGGYIMARRFWAVAELAGRSDEIQRALTGEQERLRLEYQSSVLERLGLAKEPAMHDGTPDGALLNEEIWAERVRAALQLSRSEERGRAVTVVGPHRDDLRFLLNGVDATVYGSRGQQRTVALALKLAEVGLMDAHNGEMPVLLLDDVASELDTRRARYLLDTVSRAQQVLITTTDLRDYGAAFVSEAMLWRVVAGTLTPAP